jgi:hypothetical protein
MALHDCRNGGQVKEPSINTTGFSCSNRDKLISFPIVSLRLKLTAASPSAIPALLKLFDTGGWQHGFRVSDGTGLLSSAIVDKVAGCEVEFGLRVGGSAEIGLHADNKHPSRLQIVIKHKINFVI